MAQNTVYTYVKEYNAGDVIFMQGDESDCMYEVQKGRVDLYSNYGQKDQKKLAEVVPDRIFGEMGMVEGLPRSATAVAGTDFTAVARIKWDVLGLYFKTKPARVVQMMQQMSDRLRLTTKAAMDLRNAVGESIKQIEAEEETYIPLSTLKKGLRDMDATFGINK